MKTEESNTWMKAAKESARLKKKIALSKVQKSSGEAED